MEKTLQYRYVCQNVKTDFYFNEVLRLLRFWVSQCCLLESLNYGHSHVLYVYMCVTDKKYFASISATTLIKDLHL